MPRAESARPVRSMIAGLVRLKTRADFVRVAAGRSRAVRSAFIVQAAPQPTGDDNGGEGGGGVTPRPQGGHRGGGQPPNTAGWGGGAGGGPTRRGAGGR